MESASSKSPMVRYWMHTGFLNVSGEKMSKSLGNYITIQELLENHEADTFRFLVLSTHYRSPIDFSLQAMEQAEKSLNRIRKMVQDLRELIEKADPRGAANETYLKILTNHKEQFFKDMDNDFNTPRALSTVFNLIRDLRKSLQKERPSRKVLEEILLFFYTLEDIMGFHLKSPDFEDSYDKTKELLKIILELREDLRSRREWELSDKIRKKLVDLGFEIHDKY